MSPHRRWLVFRRNNIIFSGDDTEDLLFEVKKCHILQTKMKLDTCSWPET
ncbi:hypothetical protein ZOSMA_172G00010 [Zostera marina]|uniref:Uncharacterized protein n=1 Tax=Zostera marina TaxID=29655 RepID=A0A0K9PUG3_ZOSMR|nr:hypothetical protein ZOSMA_172G00010 [Zostera marina]